MLVGWFGSWLSVLAFGADGWWFGFVASLLCNLLPSCLPCLGSSGAQAILPPTNSNRNFLSRMGVYTLTSMTSPVWWSAWAPQYWSTRATSQVFLSFLGWLVGWWVGACLGVRGWMVGWWVGACLGLRGWLVGWLVHWTACSTNQP